MTQLTRKQQQLFNALSIVVGNAMYALTVVLFLMPSGLITGGATGIALAFNKVTGLPVSAVLFVVNVAMLLLGWWVLASLIVNEARSILENLVEMGYDVPGFLVKGLAVTQKLIEAKNPAANLTDTEKED